MFKLKQKKSYFWPVTVYLPEDGGVFSKHTFDAEFRRLEMGELNELSAKNDGFSMDDEDHGADACRSVLIGWKGVTDDEGVEIPFSETSCDELLKNPHARVGILEAFRESINTRTGARRKN